MPNIAQLIQQFMQSLPTSGLAIYNEFSLQHELGIFLRNNLPGYEVQFERNVESFGFNKASMIKNEIDIVIYKPDLTEKYAIELKYPRNGEYPVQMLHFIEDIRFMEDLKNPTCLLQQNSNRYTIFDNTYTLTLVDDYLFYSGPTTGGIYQYFRGNPTQPIQGTVTYTTTKKGVPVSKTISINRQHQVIWQSIGQNISLDNLDLTLKDYCYYIIQI